MSRRQGRLKVWKDDKGYGFIAPNEGGDDVFVHIRAIGGLRGRPTGGERVTYDVNRDQQGRWRAVDVMVIPDVAPSLRTQSILSTPSRSPTSSLLIALRVRYFGNHPVHGIIPKLELHSRQGSLP